MSKLHALALLTFTMPLTATTATAADAYPTKTIRIIASEAGSSLDQTTRIIAQEIAGPMGQPVIVENRSSTITGQSTARANPDGYTIGLGAGSMWLGGLTQKISYDPVKDLAPITTAVSYPSVLIIHPSVAAKTVKELIDLAKAKPGVLNYGGSADAGAATFLYMELLKAMAGVDIVRIPYKGSAPALIGVMSGEAHMMIISPATAMPNVKSGKLRVLGVTSAEPTALVPGVPTLAATGLPGYEAVSIAGILAPAGTPAAIITRLNQEIVRALNKPEIKEKFFATGAEVAPSTPEQFASRIKAEMAKWSKVLRAAGVKLVDS